MTTEKSAFPITAPNGGERGMTLRDYFAGQALVGLLGYPTHGDLTTPATRDDIAVEAYRQADAMMAVRDQKSPSPGATP